MIKHRRDDDEDTMVAERDAPEQFAASGLTVTVSNPTPPTNIPYVATGSPPIGGVAFGPPNTPPTLTGDAALVPPAGVSPKIGPSGTAPAGSLTAVAAPSGGSGPAPEATGSVVVVTAPGSVPAAPTQSISVMGSYTTTPNASHASSQAPVTLPTITACSR